MSVSASNHLSQSSRTEPSPLTSSSKSSWGWLTNFFKFFFCCFPFRTERNDAQHQSVSVLDPSKSVSVLDPSKSKSCSRIDTYIEPDSRMDSKFEEEPEETIEPQEDADYIIIPDYILKQEKHQENLITLSSRDTLRSEELPPKKVINPHFQKTIHRRQ